MTTAVRDRPILFSALMVRALLEGRKTQTRRIIKFGCVAPLSDFTSHGTRRFSWCDEVGRGEAVDEDSFLSLCPYGVLGDRLWVRECLTVGDETWHYAADGVDVMFSPENETAARAWCFHKDGVTCPSIHMPRWASRLMLEITDVRVQRVEDISEQDAEAEGVAPIMPPARNAFSSKITREAFLTLFYDINKRALRGSNPWVWAITFKREGGC